MCVLIESIKMNKSTSLIFSVVDEFKGFQVSDFLDKIYEPEFWLPFLSLQSKEIEKTAPFQFKFKIQDNVPLDLTGLLKVDFKSEGTIKVIDSGIQDEKGYLWDIFVDVLEPKAKVEARIRAKNLNKSMKVGVYVYKLDFDQALLKGMGREVVIFASRFKIRELFDKIQKQFKK